MNWFPHREQQPETEAEWFDALISLARYLRTPEGCPWDREQTALTFANFHAEEAKEYADAVASSDNRHAAEELGDSLFILLSSAAAAESEGRFLLRDALAAAHEKMIRRHEHVFGETKAATAEEAIEMWNKVKAQEKQRQ